MLPPQSVTDPIRITSSMSSTKAQSPTELTLDTFPLDVFLDPSSSSVPSADRAVYSLSPSRSQFGESIHDGGKEFDLVGIDAYIGSFPGEEKDFTSHSGTTTAAPTRPPSPSPEKRQSKTTHNQNLSRLVLPATLVQRRGRSGSTHQIRLWPLKTYRLHTRSRSRRRSVSNVRNVGHKPKELRRVGKERCWTWVTSEPPSPVANPQSKEPKVEEKNLEEKNLEEKDKYSLLRLLDTVITNVQSSLDDLSVEENSLFLHHQHDLSILDMEADADMFRLEGKMADLEECLERVKSLRDDIGFEHRWEQLRRDNAGGGDVDAAESMELYVKRRLKECFERSTWWTEYDPLQGQK